MVLTNETLTPCFKGRKLELTVVATNPFKKFGQNENAREQRFYFDGILWIYIYI